ncbi:MAG: hypothetical protein DI570_28520 [Phenylobacterium zucineum]|nr:MAG: hypothetical protein DI570_28520 [Phenylobacterium zucineum]
MPAEPGEQDRSGPVVPSVHGDRRSGGQHDDQRLAGVGQGGQQPNLILGERERRPVCCFDLRTEWQAHEGQHQVGLGGESHSVVAELCWIGRVGDKIAVEVGLRHGIALRVGDPIAGEVAQADQRIVDASRIHPRRTAALDPRHARVAADDSDALRAIRVEGQEIVLVAEQGDRGGRDLTSEFVMLICAQLGQLRPVQRRARHDPRLPHRTVCRPAVGATPTNELDHADCRLVEGGLGQGSVLESAP